MRVGLDARLLGQRGIGRYVQGLLEGMEGLANRPEVVAFTRPGSPFLSLPDFVQVRELKSRQYLRLEQSVLPRAAEEEKCDVLHLCDNLAALSCRMPQVVTLHDQFFLEYPGTRQRRPGLKAYGAWFYRRKLFRRSLDRAEKIVCPSQSTADSLLKSFPQYYRKTSVARLAAGPPFSKQDSEATARTANKFGLSGPYYLLVCGADRRKNLGEALDGFLMFKKKRGSENTQLALYGMDSKGLLRHWPKIGKFVLEHENRAVRNLGWVPDSDLAALLSGARGLLFPSLNEGVGLPALEAARCGCPVITSRALIFKEYLGNAAIFVEPKAKGFTEALWELDSSEERRGDLSSAGAKQNKAFSWVHCAEAHVGIYRACLPGGGPA